MIGIQTCQCCQRVLSNQNNNVDIAYSKQFVTNDAIFSSSILCCAGCVPCSSEFGENESALLNVCYEYDSTDNVLNND